ncbi:hypothetical protein VNO78_21883 [Psophocarpus tetragonolobus]|uniref:S-protein homolog n=1 Tax=Psophocarpus tetragonolobus TaxID=3891 RepID=A0AAN9SCP9_PSOTE
MEKNVTISAILVLATFALAFASANIYPEFIKWHVYIVNGLSNNQNLWVHCKSSDNDLGTQILSQGSNFTWSFRIDFGHSTLFWCHLKKENVCESARFDAFWFDDRLFEKCGWKNCVWTARDDAIYLTTLDGKVSQLYYQWDAGD